MSRVVVVRSLFAFACALSVWAPLHGATAKDGVKPQPKLGRPVRQGGIFSEIMVPLGEPSLAETVEFSRAVRAYQAGGDPMRVKPLLEFLDRNPRSPWAGTAHMALGMIYRESKQPAMAAASFRRAQSLFEAVADDRKGAMGMADWAAIEAAEQEAKKGEMGGLVRVANRLTGRAMGTAPTLVGGRRFEYDVENRLVSITMGTHVTEFDYDPAGYLNAIREKEAGEITSDKRYLWDSESNTMVVEETPDGTTLREFHPQGFIDSDGTALIYTRDHLGSVRELTDTQGQVRARYDYDPWGRVTKVAGDKDSPFLFTGHLWHAQTKLYLTLYRAYDSNLGRWTTRDPYAENGGLNLYGYVFNNPINLIDPFGLDGIYYWPSRSPNGSYGHVATVIDGKYSSLFPDNGMVFGKGVWHTYADDVTHYKNTEGIYIPLDDTPKPDPSTFTYPTEAAPFFTPNTKCVDDAIDKIKKKYPKWKPSHRYTPWMPRTPDWFHEQLFTNFPNPTWFYSPSGRDWFNRYSGGK